MQIRSRDAIRTRVIVTRREFLALRTDLRQRTPAVDTGILTICALSHEM